MPGHKIDRNYHNSFLEKVKTKRIELKDSNNLNNYCAVQVNFGNNYIQNAVAFSVRPNSSELFSVGNHSEVRAIARCIYQEITRDDTQVSKNGITSAFLPDGFIMSSGDALAQQVEIFFTNNPGCSVVGYSDRQPCKEPSFAANKPYQGCEKFLQRILPGDQHKIDYSFPYVEKQQQGKYGQYTQYVYDDREIQATFQQELQSSPKTGITYFTSKRKSSVFETASLPADAVTHASSSSVADGPVSSTGEASSPLNRFENQETSRFFAQSDEQQFTNSRLSNTSLELGGKLPGIETGVDSSDDEPPTSKPKLTAKPK